MKSSRRLRAQVSALLRAGEQRHAGTRRGFASAPETPNKASPLPKSPWIKDLYSKVGKSYYGGLLAASVVCLATGIAFSKRRETRQHEAKQAAKSAYAHSPNEAPKRGLYRSPEFSRSALPARSADQQLTPKSPAVPIKPGSRLQGVELRDEDGQPFTDEQLGESFSHVYMGKDHPEAAAALAQIVVAFNKDGDKELVVLRPIVVAPDGAEVDVCPYYEAAAQPKEVLLVLTGPPEVIEQLAAAPEGYGSEASPDTGALEKAVDVERMIFLVDPEGEILAAYAIDADPDQIASATAQQINNFKTRNPGWKAKVRESVKELEEVLEEKARKAKEALTRPLHRTSSSLGQAAETTMSKVKSAPYELAKRTEETVEDGVHAAGSVVSNTAEQLRTKGQEGKDTAAKWAKQLADSARESARQTAEAAEDKAQQAEQRAWEAAQETKESAKSSAQRLADRAKELADRARQEAAEKLSHARDTAEDMVGEAKQSAQQAAETARRKAQEAESRTREVAQQTSERARASAQSTAEKARQAAEEARKEAADKERYARQNAQEILAQAQELAQQAAQKSEAKAHEAKQKTKEAAKQAQGAAKESAQAAAERAQQAAERAKQEAAERTRYAQRLQDRISEPDSS